MNIMELVFGTVLSMSLSGAVLTMALLLGGRFWKGRLGRQWQYYIWLAVLLRLFLPFGPKVSLMGKVYQMTEHGAVQMARELPLSGDNGEQGAGQNDERNAEYSQIGNTVQNVMQENTHLAAGNGAGKYLWVVWLAAAFGMLIRKISMYQSYVKYVKAGGAPVNDVALLDQLAATAQELGIDRAVELCVNPLVDTPMLAGYFHPCIVLPRADVPEKEFQYIAMHELTHYRRRDILYKWLVQIAVCLHWFNPFVYVMRREIDKACEFSCDEAVISKAGHDHAKDYGETLLAAMAAAGTCREPFAAVTMSANKELLKERLGAIMNCGKKTRRAGIITAGLTACIALGAVFIGVYPAVAAEPDKPEGVREEVWADAEKSYEARSLPMFHIAFYEMDEGAQEIWLDKFYAGGDIAFFSAGVLALDADSPLIQSFAEKFYADDDIAFFSALADHQMGDEELEGWLERALADDKWDFQSMLYDRLHQDEGKDELEKALAEEQLAQYRAVGVTQSGKNYYYEGQLVNIFLDIHTPDRSFYTLSINPAGTVNIKIVRAADGEITGAAYMTEAEAEELVVDMYGDGEEDEETEDSDTVSEGEDAMTFPREMVVTMPVCKVREGAGEAYKTVGLIGEGEQVTVLGKRKGSGGQMWYLLDKESLPEPPDDSVKSCYIRVDLLR